MSPLVTNNFIAVDIGNSRLKIGRFEACTLVRLALPEPVDTLALAIAHETGEFDIAAFLAWCDAHVLCSTEWFVGSVHRRAADRFIKMVMQWSARSRCDCPVKLLSFHDVPLVIHVERPELVGIDRLLGAFAANWLRRSDQAAIVVDLGTAITVDVLDAAGSFAGGAILPGIATSARALAEQTDALPLISLDGLADPPAPLGKSTVAAIQSGLFWGALGAIREIASRMAADMATLPDIFVTGGGAPRFVELLGASGNWSVHHVPHMVLSGIALVHGGTLGEPRG
jgi:type III pantothenate kinase